MHETLPTLDQLGLNFNTDKSSKYHNYLSYYERFIRHLRESEVNLLEIGILDGASLKMWRQYFAEGSITGADITPSTKRFETDRIKIEILDQSNLEELVRLASKAGPFDIIVEDGSHLWEHQITTLKTLFPFVRNGGFYIVEDLQTNYGDLQKSYRGVSSISCVEYLKRIVDYRVADDCLDITSEEDPFVRTYGRSMNLSFYKRSCVIEKSYQEIKRSVRRPDLTPLVEASDSAIAIGILAHIGFVGDVYSEISHLKSPHAKGNIQAFALRPLHDTDVMLEYRVRLSDGTWSTWFSNDGLAGKRGGGVNLTGFAVRLGGSKKYAYSLRVIGVFRESDDPIVVGADQDCAPDTLASLYGLQLVLVPR